MTTAFKPGPVFVPRPVFVDREKPVRMVAWLILLYMVLLGLEGALRKWIAPGYSNPLLVVRDPVLILIYIMALRARVFPVNGFVISIAVIGLLSLALTIYLFLPYFSSAWRELSVMALYGFRANFLHMPLIFVMANVFDEEDVKRIGWWVLLAMIPMSMLMVAQFHASPDSFINGTAGLAEGAEQLATAGGKIRPAGTFSFISGPVLYCSLAAAFSIYGILSRATYKMWLLVPSGIALVVAVAVSGSRGCVVSVLLVLGAMVVIFVVRPSAVNQFGRTLITVVIAALIIARLPVFKEGIDILSERFTTATEDAQTTLAGGMFNRVIEGFTESLTNLDKFPASGYGLGIGTNVGAHLLVGRPAFLLSENEWSRVLYESGPFLGMAFLLWRTILTFRIGYLSFIALRRGATLPILLFSCGAAVLLNGQLGQPTSLGFAVVLCGLCLASMQKSPDPAPARSAIEPVISAPQPGSLPRRSQYASRLHDPNP